MTTTTTTTGTTGGATRPDRRPAIFDSEPRLASRRPETGDDLFDDDALDSTRLADESHSLEFISRPPRSSSIANFEPLAWHQPVADNKAAGRQVKLGREQYSRRLLLAGGHQIGATVAGAPPRLPVGRPASRPAGCSSRSGADRKSFKCNSSPPVVAQLNRHN